MTRTLLRPEILASFWTFLQWNKEYDFYEDISKTWFQVISFPIFRLREQMPQYGLNDAWRPWKMGFKQYLRLACSVEFLRMLMLISFIFLQINIILNTLNPLSCSKITYLCVAQSIVNWLAITRQIDRACRIPEVMRKREISRYLRWYRDFYASVITSKIHVHVRQGFAAWIPRSICWWFACTEKASCK